MFSSGARHCGKSLLVPQEAALQCVCVCPSLGTPLGEHRSGVGAQGSSEGSRQSHTAGESIQRDQEKRRRLKLRNQELSLVQSRLGLTE